MTKKLLVLLLAAVCFTLCLCGCEKESQDLLKQRSLQQILDAADNEVALEKALTVEYSLDDFKEFEENSPRLDSLTAIGKSLLTTISNPLVSFPSLTQFTLSEVNQNFPIEVLRCVPNSVLTQDSSVGTRWYYAVYKIDQGGYLYCFFYGPKETTQDSPYNDYYMYFSLYAKKTLTARQLDSVVEGDSLQQVRRAAGEMVLYPDFGESSPYSFSIHLLEDDLLAYVYDGDDNIIAKFSFFEPIPQQYKEDNKDCFVLQYGHLMLAEFSSVPILPQDMP